MVGISAECLEKLEKKCSEEFLEECDEKFQDEYWVDSKGKISSEI